MRILLLGRNGQVGWELQRSLAPLGELVALDATGADGLCGDLARPAELATTVRALAPGLIVNAAAYTAVDRAEAEPERARAVNAAGPAVLAQEAAALGAWLVHYGTDYVFDGSGNRPWAEDDPTGPLNVYGRTKLEGEQAIRTSGCAHLILRTSWVHSARGANFARTMLRLAGEREQLQVVADQYGAPTGADLIADVTAHAIRAAMARPALSGTYQLAAGGETNWHGYARHVVAFAQARGHPMRVHPDTIVPVSSADFPSAAQRPHNSRLDTRKLRQAFALQLPAWQFGVERMLQEVLA